MKFYLTVENKEKVRTAYYNLHVYYILDVNEVIDKYGLDMSKPSNCFFISQEIEKIIKTKHKSKSLEGIIYINPNINEKICDSLYKLLVTLPKMEGMVLLDDPIFPKLEHMYHLFEEVVFFPTVRRVKLIECKPLKVFEDSSCKDTDTIEMLKNLRISIPLDRTQVKPVLEFGGRKV